MSALPSEPIRMSETEYLEFERQSEARHEYIHGEVVAMAGASRAHSLIRGNLMALLKNQLRGRNCEVHDNNLRVKVEATGLYTYPDLSVVCGEVKMVEGIFDTLSNPTLIIEVLSPSTELYDRGAKFSDYQKIASVKEYVLVAQDKPRVEHYLRVEANKWTLTTYEGLDAQLELSSINATLSLAEIYEQVNFS